MPVNHYHPHGQCYARPLRNGVGRLDQASEEREVTLTAEELNGKAESAKLLFDMAERIRDLEAEVERLQQRAQAAETRLALARQALRKLRR